MEKQPTGSELFPAITYCTERDAFKYAAASLHSSKFVVIGWKPSLQDELNLRYTGSETYE